MALVAAYGDSDSDTDSNEDELVEKPKVEFAEQTTESNKEFTKSTKEFQIDDEDDYWQSLNNKQNNGERTDQKLFSLLPEPKEKGTTVVEEVEDEFTRKKASDIIQTDMSQHPSKMTINKKRTLDLSKPSKQKLLKKQPVKISIPTLEEIGSDSDSDDGERKSKPQPQNKKCSLFSLLPKPQHSVAVGQNKNKVFEKQTSRVLVPHTLTKKKEIAKTDSVQNKMTNKKDLISCEENSDNDDDDDDDIEVSTNFFSLGEKGMTETKETLVIKTENNTNNNKNKQETVTVSVKPASHIDSTITSSLSKNSETKSNLYFASLMKASGTIEKSVVSKQNVNNYKKIKKYSSLGNVPPGEKNKRNIDPATSYCEVTAPYGDVTAPYGDVTAPYGDVTAPYGDNAAPRTHSYPASQSFFSYAYHNKETTPNEGSEPHQLDYYNQPNQDAPINKEALMALQGKKRKMEEINIIDVNADDVQASSDEYLKNLTKESNYQPKKSKEDLPTSNEKRKHQITYLAFQAKEREFALRQAWAENRATKQQTQSRYGF